MSEPLLKKVLVANRGEIAVRIIRACHELGIRSVAVYSTVDRAGRAVRLAHEAYPIGGPEAKSSYLDAGKIIDAALAAGADAVHPGYGFLAENEDFARRVREAGLVFIGPPAECIAAMGDKIASRRRMAEAGVPVIPGCDDENFSEGKLKAAAAGIGFPVMLKATAGGGGKGIRLVHDAADLWPSYQRVVSEAGKAFNNGRVYIERALEEPHHVEFQVFGDRHGNVVHMFERECSIQRRHQKLIEETPSPVLSPELRAKMALAAVRAARAIDYENAGTVEFLVDKSGEYYFLEMNTRIQVEHAITEEVLGIDLVKEQIRVASGLPLSFRQEDLVPRGHAIEARICAEDPDNDYLPDIGVIEALTIPAGPGIRVDAALSRGSEVTLYYDPMLAKVIARGNDRDEAIARLRQALSEFKIAGLKTNVAFLARVVRDERFLAGTYDTSFLRSMNDRPVDVELMRAAVIAAVLKRHRGTAPPPATGATECADPWKSEGRRRGVRRS